MADDVLTAADEAAAGTPIVEVTTQTDETYISPSSAARALSKRRVELAAERAKQEPAEGAEAATPQVNESASQEADAAPQDEAPGETQEADPAQQLPPIEPPRSWTKEEKAEFATYPREAQEKIARREQERERAIRQSQNEAAEKLKGLTAKEQAVEQARQQYESALPILLQNLQTAMAGEFSDIKTMADVQRMATEDWPRYIRWDAQQKQIAAVHQELQGAEQRRETEKKQKFAEFAQAEDAKLAEFVPELADSEKAGKVQNAAIALLKDIGFSENELVEAYNGQRDLSLRDHRVQRLIVDGIRYREMQKAAEQAKEKVQAKPLPPVQRPGTTQGKGAAQAAEIQNLQKQLDRASGINALRIAAKLTAAQRAAAAR